MSTPFDTFFRLAEGRRSVREFTQAPVEDESIVRLLRAACQAPSAHNRQPWRFVVVRGAERKAALANAMAERLRTERTADGDPAAEVEADVARARRRLTDAPIAVVACLTPEDLDVYTDTRRQQAERTMAIQSVAMAGENLLLAAHAEGLGACWMCAPLFAPDVVRQELDLPSTWEPQGLVLIGHAAGSSGPRRRRTVDEVTRWA